MRVAISLPCGDFAAQGLFVGDAAIQTLGLENTEFGFGHVEPAAVLGRVMPFEPFGEAARLGGGKGLVERGGLWFDELVVAVRSANLVFLAPDYGIQGKRLT